MVHMKSATNNDVPLKNTIDANILACSFHFTLSLAPLTVNYAPFHSFLPARSPAIAEMLLEFLN